MIYKSTLLECRGRSPEEAYEEMFFETAVRVERFEQQENEWDY